MLGEQIAELGGKIVSQRVLDIEANYGNKCIHRGYL
jgi:hypothetical protein